MPANPVHGCLRGTRRASPAAVLGAGGRRPRSLRANSTTPLAPFSPPGGAYVLNDKTGQCDCAPGYMATKASTSSNKWITCAK